MPEAAHRRVLVVGGTGLVGSALRRELVRRGIPFLAPPRHALDASAPAVRLPEGVDCVINAALDRGGDTGRAWAVNARFPHLLAAQCAGRGIALIHMSTDGVFSGRNGPCDEAAAPDAEDVYGRQKRDGEPASSALVLRTSVVGPEERGFVSLLCRLLTSPGPATGFANHRWNGLASPELARILAELSQWPELPAGVRHIHSDDTTKYELMSMLCRAFGRNDAVTAADAPLAVDRRLRTRHGPFMAALAVRPLAVQIDQLPAVADGLGRWKEERC